MNWRCWLFGHRWIVAHQRSDNLQNRVDQVWVCGCCSAAREVSVSVNLIEGKTRIMLTKKNEVKKHE